MNTDFDLDECLGRCFTLSRDQLAWARHEGDRRQGESVASDRTTSFGNIEGDEWFSHFIGAAGELTWCMYFDKHWPRRINNFDGPDVGKRVQVRTTSGGMRLRVKPHDHDDHAFCLAVFQVPNIVDLKGWMWGHEVKAMFPAVDCEKRGSTNLRNKPVHFAPRKDLHPLRSLPKEVLDECEGPFRMPRGMK